MGRDIDAALTCARSSGANKSNCHVGRRSLQTSKLTDGAFPRRDYIDDRHTPEHALARLNELIVTAATSPAFLQLKAHGHLPLFVYRTRPASHITATQLCPPV